MVITYGFLYGLEVQFGAGSSLCSPSCLVSREKRFSDWYCDGGLWVQCLNHHTLANMAHKPR